LTHAPAPKSAACGRGCGKNANACKHANARNARRIVRNALRFRTARVRGCGPPAIGACLEGQRGVGAARGVVDGAKGPAFSNERGQQRARVGPRARAAAGRQQRHRHARRRVRRRGRLRARGSENARASAAMWHFCVLQRTRTAQRARAWPSARLRVTAGCGPMTLKPPRACAPPCGGAVHATTTLFASGTGGSSRPPLAAASPASASKMRRVKVRVGEGARCEADAASSVDEEGASDGGGSASTSASWRRLWAGAGGGGAPAPAGGGAAVVRAHGARRAGAGQQSGGAGARRNGRRRERGMRCVRAMGTTRVRVVLRAVRLRVRCVHSVRVRGRVRRRRGACSAMSFFFA
jgi:hypothetical protein